MPICFVKFVVVGEAPDQKILEIDAMVRECQLAREIVCMNRKGSYPLCDPLKGFQELFVLVAGLFLSVGMSSVEGNASC